MTIICNNQKKKKLYYLQKKYNSLDATCELKITVDKYRVASK